MSDAANPAPPGGAAVPAAPPGGKPSRRRLAVAAGVVVLLAAGFGIWYGLVRSAEQKDDLERLQGEWRVTLPGGTPGRNDSLTVIRIKGDRWSYVAGGREMTVWRLTLDPAADPKEIDLVLTERDGLPVPPPGSGPEPRQVGIYALDGDTLRWARNPAAGPDARPRSLDDPDAVVLTLTRIGK